MTRRVALLRGVNLGGRKLLMSDLARICGELGYQDIRTLLASGNVMFTANAAPEEIERALKSALARFGLKTEMLLRDRAELERVAANNPFPDAVCDHPSHVLVTFHREPFPSDALERLRDIHRGAERLHAVGRELFVDFGGREQMRESTLLGSMRKARFPTVATARNWNTVTKLIELLA